MKPLLLTFLFTLFTTISFAQLPAGSTAPNWTMTDINGTTHTLYDYLNDGKTVFLDFSATWCGPCWSYHNTHALKDLYEQYGPNGTDEVMVFFIEAEANSNTACLYGPSGCNNSTWGNWVASTPYPIIDNASQNGPYNVNAFPTIYGICSDYSTYSLGQLPTGALYNFAQGCAGSVTYSGASVTDVSCFGGADGIVDINVGGSPDPITYQWSNGASTQDLVNVSEGVYQCTVTNGNGATVVTDPIVVSAPLMPVSPTLVFSTNESCQGNDGTIDTDAFGGTPPYTYLWNTGEETQDAFGLVTGLYTLTVTDWKNCTEVLSNVFVDQDQPPIANAGQGGTIDCNDVQLVLNGGGSTFGGNVGYNWSTSDGNIIDGAFTMFPIIDQPGTYTLTVINLDNNCEATDEVIVTGDVTAPTIVIASPGDLNCNNTNVTLDASGSASGGNIVYEWTTNNGNIVSGGATNMPLVDASGDYTLLVNNIDNGCTASMTVEVAANVDAPMADAGNSDQLTCTISNLNLDGSNSSNGSDITYSWSTINGNIVSGGTTITPEIDAPGNYILLVTNTDNGCTASAAVEITADANTPIADAGNTSSLTCAVNNLDLDGSNSSSGSDITYSWSTNDGNIVSGGTTATPAVDAAGTYTLLVTNATNGCTATAEVSINMDVDTPVADAGTANQLTCAVNNLDLDGSNSSNGSGIIYSWSTNDGNIVSGGTTTTPAIDAAGVYTLLVTNTSNGCTATSVVTVAQNVADPIANAGNSQTLTCSQSSTLLDGSSSSLGSGFEYNWTTNDGNIISGATTLTPNISAAGTYSLMVTNTNNGCTSVAQVVIDNDTNAPIAAAGENGVLTCTVSALNLDGSNSSSGADITYDWSTNDGNIVSGGTTMTPAIDATGTYTLLVTNTANGCSTQATVEVIENVNAPIAEVATSNPLSCILSEITLDGSNSTTGNNINYDWNTNDGNIISGATTMNPDISTAGTYSLLVTNTENGCTASTQIQVEEDITTPIVDAGIDAALTCSELSLSLNGTNSSSGSDFDYQWSTIDGNIVSGGTSATPIINAPGTYVLQVVNGLNGCIEMDAVVITENTIAPIADAGSTLELHCNLTVANLDGSNSSTGNDIDYQWTTNDGNIVSGGTTISPSVNAEGTYSLLVTNTDNGCTASSTIEVTEASALELALDSQVNNDCNNDENGAITLEVNGGTGDYDYLWSNGETSSDAQNLTAGVYTVSVSDENNCTQSLTISISEPEVLSVEANSTNESAAGANDGTATVNPEGGTAPYSFSWDNGETSATIENLAPGNYIVLVTDENDCINQATVTVNSFDCAVTAEIVAINLSCATSNDGQAIVSMQGGTAPYNYLWSNGATTATINNLSPGSYAVTATDASNCPSTTNITITQPEALNAAINANEMVSCNGGDNGSATVNVNGGTGSYSFTWSNGMTGATTSDLSAGIYTVEIEDENNCIIETQVEITEPNLLVVQMNSTNESSANANDGTATANPTGGTVPYSYAWNTGATTDQIINLTPGNYTVSISDANDCEEVQTVIINSFDCALALETSTINADCNGAANGQAAVEIANGNGPFTYEWSNGTNLAIATNLTIGNYSVIVTDASNCSQSTTVEITEPNSVEIELTNQTNVDCNGNTTGAVSLAASGGTGSLNYLWSDGNTNANRNNLSAGTYTILVSDANNCQSSIEVNITEPIALLVNTNATNETSLNANDGTASAGADGGVGPYEYLWNTGATTASITNLAAGTYTVNVMDANDCTTTGTVVVNGFDCAIDALVTNTNISCFGANDGTATVIVNGGTAPFSYLWSNAATTPMITNLSSGVYTLTITDANDCPTLQSINIVEPTALYLDLVNQSNVVCASASNGMVELSATGGVGPYNYSWPDGNASATRLDLGVGIYDVAVMDANQCNANITIEITANDTELPMVLTQNLIVGLDDNGAAMIMAEQINEGSSDNCGIASMNLDLTNFDCSHLGDNEVMLTIVDLSGNENSAPATVTIRDNVKPILDCPENMEVFSCDGIVEYAFPTVWDNCSSGNPTITQGLGSGSVFPLGTTMEEYIFTDASGNAANCSFVITMSGDVELPEAIGNDLIIDLDENGAAVITTAQIDNGSTDNCGIASMNLDLMNFDCSHLGNNTIQFTVTDLGGNNASAMVNVTVEDNIEPILTCPENISVVNCDGLVEYSLPEVWDNCAVGTPLLTQGLGTGMTFPAGETMEEYSFTDEGGNIATCSFIVTVNSDLALNEINSQDVCFGESNGSASVEASGGSAGYNYTWSNGQVGSTANDLAAGTYEIVVTDANNCSQSIEVTIEAYPEIQLSIDEVINDMNNNGEGGILISVVGGSGSYNFEWIQDGVIVSTEEDPMNLMAGNYVCQITDSNGCIIASNPVTIDNITNITETELARGLRLFPNPTADEILLQMTFDQPYEVQVFLYDVTGRLLSTTVPVTKATHQMEWSFATYPSGVYFAKIRVDEVVMTKRIVVSR